MDRAWIGQTDPMMAVARHSALETLVRRLLVVPVLADGDLVLAVGLDPAGTPATRTATAGLERFQPR